MALLSWPELVGPLFILIFVIALLIGLVVHMRRREAQVEEMKDRKRHEEVRIDSLKKFLLLKIDMDLNGEETSPVIRAYLKAFRDIVDRPNPDIGSLRAIAEVYRHRRGFNPLWLGHDS